MTYVHKCARISSPFLTRGGLFKDKNDQKLSAAQGSSTFAAAHRNAHDVARVDLLHRRQGSDFSIVDHLQRHISSKLLSRLIVEGLEENKKL